MNRDYVLQVWKRQPHGADLLPAGRDAVGDPPRHDQMASRVVVGQREAEPVVMNRDEDTAERGNRADRQRQVATAERYNHLFIL